MAADHHVSVVRTLVDAFNAKDRDRLMACYSTDLVVHGASGATRTMDHDEHWHEVQQLYAVFPDVSARIDHLVADDQSVFLRGWYTATHAGKVDESVFEPSGLSATWAWWCEYRFDGGKIVEAWNIYDDLERLRQHGHWEPPKAKTDG